MFYSFCVYELCWVFFYRKFNIVMIGAKLFKEFNYDGMNIKMIQIKIQNVLNI